MNNDTNKTADEVAATEDAGTSSLDSTFENNSEAAKEPVETPEGTKPEGSSNSEPAEPTDAEALANEDSTEETGATSSEDESDSKESTDEAETTPSEDAEKLTADTSSDNPNARWYVVHTYSGHENKVATALKQRVESEHLEHKILDVLVPTQEKIEIKGGKKGTVKEKIFPGYILVKMELDDLSWLAVRTTQGVTAFVGMGNKPTPIPDSEVKSIVRFMTQGAAPTFKDVYLVDDTVKITDGPFSEFIGKVDSVDKEHGKVRVLVSIFGRETPVELDFLQVQKL